MKLSILICTIPQRTSMFNAIHTKLQKQVQAYGEGKVEILFDSRTEITTGHKRNLLIEKSKGEFVVFVDDDDDVYDYYVEEILKSITENPNVDCIGINGIISFNGENHKKWFISKKFERWYESAEVYYRTPNHISPIRKTIAQLVPFPNIHHGEDFAYSIGIFSHLHSEATIKKPLYHYQARVSITNHPPNQDENGAPYRPAWR